MDFQKNLFSRKNKNFLKLYYMDLIAFGSLLGVVGLLAERLFKTIRKSSCTHIHSKCCGSEIDIDRKIENNNTL